jgi:hypothetical protein
MDYTDILQKQREVSLTQKCDLLYRVEAALGGLVVIVLATGPKVRWFKPGRRRRIFCGDKNPEHDFLRGERKATV